MPRPPRHAPANESFHVWTRAIRKELTYVDEHDEAWFVGLLAKVVDRYEWNLLAYCLMSTHYHLAVHTPAASLSAGMHVLNGAYARRFNWRHGHRGHLFARRFGSVMAESTEHALEQIRYVVLNPVRAGLVEHPREWAASSYNATVGHLDAPAFLATDRIADLFAGRGRDWRVRFAEFIDRGIVPGGRVLVPGTKTAPAQPGAPERRPALPPTGGTSPRARLSARGARTVA